MSRTYINNMCDVCGQPFEEGELVFMIRACKVTTKQLETFNKRKLKKGEVRLVYVPNTKRLIHEKCIKKD